MSIVNIGKKSRIIKNWRMEPKSIEKYQFVHNFLPQPELRKRANLLSGRAVVIYCLAMLIIVGVFRLLPIVLPGVMGYASNISVSDLLNYTNQKRKEAGLSALALNESLTSAAHKKAEDMFENQYWAHVSPGGKEPWDFILGQNYDYIYAGENLAKNFNDSKDVVEAWMKSPSHRENLLSSNYDEIGFAVVNGVMDGYETTLVVQMFGRPRNPAQVASVYESEEVLKEVENKTTAEQPQEISKEAPVQAGSTAVYETKQPVKNKPAIDVTTATKTVSGVFGGFVGTLLALDVWYSKRKGLAKFTGHTFAHLGVLLLVLVSIWFVLTPGIII